MGLAVPAPLRDGVKDARAAAILRWRDGGAPAATMAMAVIVADAVPDTRNEQRLAALLCVIRDSLDSRSSFPFELVRRDRGYYLGIHHVCDMWAPASS